jgi:hypothetical protein
MVHFGVMLKNRLNRSKFFTCEKTLQSNCKVFFYFIRTKGMGEIFHGQTKGYMFVVTNFTYRIYHVMHPRDNVIVCYFT